MPAPDLARFSPPTFEPLFADLARQGWSVRPDFIPAELAEALRRESLEQWDEGEFRHATIGRGEHNRRLPEVRGDQIRWLDHGSAAPAQRLYLEWMEALRRAANRELFLGLEEFEVHAARYPEGRGYQRHLDRFEGSEERILTCVLYLNPGWSAEEGGALRLYTDQGEVDVLPEEGLLASFITEGMWHEVLPTHRPRLALTGWYRRMGRNGSTAGL